MQAEQGNDGSVRGVTPGGISGYKITGVEADRHVNAGMFRWHMLRFQSGSMVQFHEPDFLDFVTKFKGVKSLPLVEYHAARRQSGVEYSVPETIDTMSGKYMIETFLGVDGMRQDAHCIEWKAHNIKIILWVDVLLGDSLGRMTFYPELKDAMYSMTRSPS